MYIVILVGRILKWSFLKELACRTIKAPTSNSPRWSYTFGSKAETFSDLMENILTKTKYKHKYIQMHKYCCSSRKRYSECHQWLVVKECLEEKHSIVSH